MSKLEEQLRASRQRERTDLQPPANGWANVASQLDGAHVAGGAPTEIGAGSRPGSAWPWITGVFSLLVVVGLCWQFWSVSEATDLSVDKPLSVSQASELPAEASNTVTKPTEIPAESEATSPVRPATITQAAPESAVLSSPTSASTTPALAPTFQAPTTPVDPSKIIADLSPKLPLEDGPKTINNPTATTFASLTLDDSPATLTNGPNTPKLSPAALPESTLATPIAATTNTTPPQNTSFSQPTTTTTPITTTTPTLPKLGSPTITSRNVLPLRIPALEIAAPRQHRKPRGRAEWQAHLTVNALSYDQSWNNGRKYRHSDDPSPGFNFVLPTGELIGAERVSGEDRLEGNRFTGKMVRFGIDRQLHWGGTIRSSIGLYRSTVRSTISPDAVVPADQIWTKYQSSEWAVPLELGFRYTFRRRKRLRSFLELNMAGFLYYEGEESTIFLDGQSGQVGLVQGFRSKEYAPIYLDPAAAAGIQYQLTPKLAISVLAWVNGGSTIFVEAPFGFEVRHSLR